MCQAILFNSAQVSGGMGYIFNAIVAVVVGGVLLTGGFGSVIGIFVGTITFAIVSQGIYFTDIDRNWSNLIIGVMLLLAVMMNQTFREMARSYIRGKASIPKTPVQPERCSSSHRPREDMCHERQTASRTAKRQQVLRSDRRAARHLAEGACTARSCACWATTVPASRR